MNARQSGAISTPRSGCLHLAWKREEVHQQVVAEAIHAGRNFFGGLYVGMCRVIAIKAQFMRPITHSSGNHAVFFQLVNFLFKLPGRLSCIDVFQGSLHCLSIHGTGRIKNWFVVDINGLLKERPRLLKQRCHLFVQQLRNIDWFRLWERNWHRPAVVSQISREFLYFGTTISTIRRNNSADGKVTLPAERKVGASLKAVLVWDSV